MRQMARATLLQEQRERIGRNIRRARLQAGLSHDKLAEAVGSSRQHLIKLEKGQHLAGPVLLDRIAEETGKPVDWLTGDGEEDEESRAVALDRVLLAQVHAALGLALGVEA